MLGNIGDLFVKCMQQVTKGHLYRLFWVSDYYVMYRQRAKYTYYICMDIFIMCLLRVNISMMISMSTRFVDTNAI